MADAYPLAFGATEIGLGIAEAGFLAALAIPLYVLWLENHNSHKDSAHAQPKPSDRRNFGPADDPPDGAGGVHDPDDPPETLYHYTGNYIDDANEIGYGHREKKYIAYSFQNWAHHVYGNRYRILSGVALAIARRRYQRWIHGHPRYMYTPLRRQVFNELNPFDSPQRPVGRTRRKRRYYSSAELAAL